MADANGNSGLGTWQDANLRLTANANAGLGADAGVPVAVRFRSAVAKLVRRRLAVRGSDPDASLPAVFLLMPSPPPTANTYSPKRVPRLDSGREVLCGRVWFVGAGPGSGHFIPAEHGDDDLLYTFVTDTLALAETPAIVFDPRIPNLHVRYYPHGLADPDSFEDMEIGHADVTIEKVTEAISTTHKKKMITPDAQTAAIPLWVDRDKWWPHSNAEERVQGYLEIALNAAFPTCTVRTEQTGMAEGRLDIEIVENDPIDPSKVTQHGILELKVLRSFGSTGRKESKRSVNEWISSGVEQAAAYRESKRARWSALICFDMRNHDVGDAACFRHVRTLAFKLDVELRRWYLYATSKQLRSALAAAKI